MINDHETGPSVQIKSTKQMRVIKATEELDRYAIFLASFATRVRRTFFYRRAPVASTSGARGAREAQAASRDNM